MDDSVAGKDPSCDWQHCCCLFRQRNWIKCLSCMRLRREMVVDHGAQSCQASPILVEMPICM